MPLSQGSLEELRQIIASTGEAPTLAQLKDKNFRYSTPKDVRATRGSQQKEDTSFNRFKKGFIESESMGDNFGNFLSAKYPHVFGGRWFIGSDKFGTGHRTAAEIYGQDYLNLTTDQRLQYLKSGHDYSMNIFTDETENQQIQRYYAGVSSEGFAHGLGDFAGMVASPESLLLPGGLGAEASALATAAKVGGVYGGLYSTSEDLANHGSVDLGHVAVGVGLGAAGGAAVQKLAVPLARAVKNKIKDKLGSAWFDKEAANVDVRQGAIDSGKLDERTKTWLKRNTTTEFDTADKPRFVVDPETGKPRLKFRTRKGPDYIKVSEAEKPRYKLISKPGEKPRFKKVSDAKKPVYQQVSDGKGKPRYRLVEEAKKPRYKLVSKPHEKPRYKLVEEGEKGRYTLVSKPGEKPRYRLAADPKKPRYQLSSKPGEKPRFKRLSEGNKARYKLVSDGTGKPRYKLISGSEKPRYKLVSQPGEKPQYELVSEGKKPGYKLLTETQSEERAQIYETMAEKDSVDSLAFDKTWPENSPLAQKLINDIENDGVQDIGQAKSAIASGEVPHTSALGKKMADKAGRISEMDNTTWWQNNVGKLFNGQWVSQPFRVANTLGYYGKVYNELMTSAKEHINYNLANTLADYNKIFNKYHVSEQEVRDYISGLTMDVTPEVAQAGKHVKQLLDRAVHSAVKVGVLTQKEANEMLAKAAKEGYFPRVLDREFLMTRKGREAFIKELGSLEFSNEHKAESIIKSLLGEVPPDMAAALKGSKTINASMAKRIYDTTMKHVYTNESRHLEKDRILPKKFEKSLAKFMLPPKASIMSYVQDASTRIEMARNFGVKNEIFDHIITKMEHGGVSDSKLNMIKQTYFGAIRDSRSDALSSFLNQPQRMLKAHHMLTNLANYKLMFAPIYNIGQSSINGSAQTMRLRGAVNPIKAFAISMDGVLKGALQTTGLARQEAIEEIDRIGGAVSSTMMSVIGEGMSTAADTGIARAPEILNPAWWSKSTNFLRAVGYVASEVFNRRAGVFMGKALLEANIEKKIAIQAKKKLSFIDRRNLNKIDEVLNELGLDINAAAKDLTVKDLDMGSQRFSNMMNFTNDSNTTPLKWQTLHGRMLTKFKTFVLNQTTFFKVNVLESLKKGDVLPAMTYFGVGTPVGMGLDEFRRMVMGDDKHYSETQRTARAWTAFAGLGIWQDLLRQGLRGPNDLLSFAAGPIVGDVVGTAAATAKTAKNSIQQGELDFSPLLKQGVRMVPFPGKAQVQKEMKNEKRNWQKEYKNFDSPETQFVNQLLGLD